MFPVLIFAIFCLAIAVVLVNYLPGHLIMMRRRACYYLFGAEADELTLWQHLGVTHTKMRAIGEVTTA